MPDTHYLGKLSQICDHCMSLSFVNESFRCCHNGKVKLTPLSSYPFELQQLLTGRTTQSLNFQNNIRQYNSAFAFASMGANLIRPPGQGPPCFRICGQIFHRSGNLHPSEGDTPVYNQLYIIDTGTALHHRMQQTTNQSCRDDVMMIMHNVIEKCSPYLRAYEHMAEIEQNELHKRAHLYGGNPSIQMHFKRGNDQHRYNESHHDEVVVVFVGAIR